MNTTHTPEAAAVMRANAWAEVSSYALSIRHLCVMVSEQENLDDAAIALGHAMRLLADHVHSNASAYVDGKMHSSALQDTVWTDVLSKSGNIQELVDLLRDKSTGSAAGFALASGIDALASHINVLAGMYAE